jgi:hypothetical protein
MPRLADVCLGVRSKNAGPFWVTIDIVFDGAESFRRHADDPALGVAAIGALYGVDPGLVRRFAVPDLSTLKISYARPTPQGGILERDMHSGQQYVPLLEIQLA